MAVVMPPIGTNREVPGFNPRIDTSLAVPAGVIRVR
jgi:hypothetical protein